MHCHADLYRLAPLGLVCRLSRPAWISFLALAMLWAWLAAMPVSADEAVLRKAGLERHGWRWIVRSERILQGRLESLQGADKTLAAAEQAYAFQIQAYTIVRRRLAEVSTRVAGLAAVQKSAAAGSAASNAAEKELERLKPALERLQRQAVEPDVFAESTNAQLAAERLAAVQNELWLTVDACQRAIAALPDEYAALDRRAGLREAVRSMEPPAKLGPLEDYRDESSRLARWKQRLANSWTPLWRQNGDYRMTAIVGDQTPVTFTYATQSDAQTFLPASLAQAAGIESSEPETAQQLGNRQLPVRSATLKSLRLGSLVLTDVLVWILRPEDEDIGARLAARALLGHEATVEPERLRLTFKPKDD